MITATSARDNTTNGCTVLPYLRQILIVFCQCFFLVILSWIGSYYGIKHTLDNCIGNTCYFTTHIRLAKLQTTSIVHCSDLKDPHCSQQTRVNNHFFKVRAWHRTVRLLSCIIVLFILILILFGTDFIIYVDQPVMVSCVACPFLIYCFASLTAHLCMNIVDPLSILCGYDRLTNGLYEFLLNGNSKPARFYRWVKKVMKRWDVKEERLIISIIFIIVIGILITTILIYIAPFSL